MYRLTEQKETIKHFIEEQYEDYLKIYYIILNNRFNLKTLKYPKNYNNLGSFIKGFIKKNKIDFNVVFEKLYDAVDFLPFDKVLLDIQNKASQGEGMITLMYFNKEKNK